MAGKRQAQQEEVPHVQCDYRATCLEYATIRYAEKNLCVSHYLGVLGEEKHKRWVEAGRPSAAESIEKMKELANKPKPTPYEHWKRVLENPNAPMIAREAAEEYMRRFSREPGQDDEELAA